MNSQEFNKYFGELSYVNDMANYLTEYVKVNNESELFFELACGIAKLSDEMVVYKEGEFKYKEEYNDDILKVIARKVDLLIGEIKEYNHFSDFRLIIYASEILKIKKNIRLNLLYATINVAEKVEQLDMDMIREIKGSYKYISSQWEQLRKNVYSRIKAKKDSFVFNINNEEMIICGDNYHDLNKKIIKVDSKDSIYNEYKYFQKALENESADVIHLGFKSISSNCNRELNKSKSIDLYVYINTLNVNELEYLSNSIRNYGEIYRYYIYR